MPSHSDHLCDIKMQFEDWRKVKGSPLFFLNPRKIEQVISGGLTVESIYKHSSGRTFAPLGRDAIKRALDVQPTFLQKAIDIRTVINSILPKALLDEDVICAVFIIPNLKLKMQQAGLTAAKLAEAIGYNEATVLAAIDNYRLPFVFANRVVDHLIKHLDPSVGAIPFISIEEGNRLNIKNLGDKEKPLYVFDRRNLDVAAATGHLWARA